jgi:hypothetical protein
VKVRAEEGKAEEVPVADVVAAVEAKLAALRADIEATVIDMPYEV